MTVIHVSKDTSWPEKPHYNDAAAMIYLENVANKIFIYVSKDGKAWPQTPIYSDTFRMINIQNSENKNTNKIIYVSKDTSWPEKPHYNDAAAMIYLENVANKIFIYVSKDGKAWPQTPIYSDTFRMIHMQLAQKGEETQKIEGNIVWQSKGSWDKNGERRIENEGFDPQDKRFLVRQMSDEWERDEEKNEPAGEFKGYFDILGNGEAEFSMAQGRFYVFKNEQTMDFKLNIERDLWSPNLEVSCDIKIEDLNYPRKNKKFINIGGCTNHFAEVEENSNGRNYSMNIELEDQKVGFKKETIHDVYDTPDETEKKLEFPLHRYVNLKFSQRVLDDNNIELEEWIDEVPIGKYTDSGQMTNLDEATPKQKEKLEAVLKEDKKCLFFPLQSKTQVWSIGAYSGLYIRINRVKKGYIKNLTVKEF